MAVITLRPQINIGNISRGMNSLKFGVTRVRKNASNIRGILFRRTKVKRENISRSRFFQNKKDQIENRKNQEDILEASGINGVAKRTNNIIVNSTRGFLGRILDFLGTLLVGWLVNNLPSIITMAKELIARIQRMYQLMTGFFKSMFGIFTDFGRLLGAVFQNVISFDFFDTSNRVKNAMGDLEGNFDDIHKQFEEGIRLLTTSLGEGIVTGEDAAPFGTDYTTPPGENKPTPSGGGGGGRWKPLLDLISSVESPGNQYNAIAPGDYNPNLSKMTIAEANKAVGVKGGRGAIGRYQLTNPIGQAAAAGLKPTDLFSPKNQDKIAIKLIEGRGGNDWLSGKITDRKFAQNLSAEWRGLPYDERNQTYPDKYAGGNKAHTSFSEVLSSLKQVKTTPASTTSTPSSSIPSPPSSRPTLGGAVPIQPGKRYRGGENLKSTIGKGVRITDAYGARGGTHKGLDIAAPNGTYIALRYDCEVVAAGWYGKYGNLIDVWVPTLKVQLRMAHLSALIIRSGKIPAGRSFARVGSTGRSTGPHIHFEYDTVRGRSNYGGSGDPSAYAVALILTSKPNTANFAVPSVSSVPSLSAQIYQPPTSTSQFSFNIPQVPNQTNIVPQKMGQQIVVIDDIQPAQPQIQASAQPQIIPIIIPINPLNNLIKNKLFIDLAYT